MTYFTQNKKTFTLPKADQPLLMEGLVIKNEPRIKILGIIFDQNLKYREHILRARDKGIKAVLALKQLKNLRPEVAKKLFYSKVSSITDYALPM